MKKTRSQLDQELDDLAAHTQKRVEEDPDSPFLIDEFAGVADEILEAASDEDHDHVWSRMQCILRDNGLIPGDDEPCDDR
ncbi:hypothetical protein [Luteimonas sp. MHLX1A]|uniref:hypothetical protein n=1 Tax=Alterluteimonas muca TaxID=2878684 RepID=UPI001E2E4AFC|nr:hypothetical protein [Luteimonas sp. MHLX1A]MCD9046808.1 hypothetical protein [Luteimonas sp. MHLX1A]